MRDMVQVRRGARKEYQGPDARIGRSQFNRSHGLKMTFDVSYLYPILVDEVLPGDTFTCSLNGFARIFSPLDAPVMDNIEMETLFFFCPTRLLWDNWEYFNGAHDAAGAQDTSYTIPVLATGWTVNHDTVVTGHGLAAYMGLPEGMTTAGTVDINALPFRMYNILMNDWFVDQNVMGAEVFTLNTDNGPDSVGDYVVHRSSKKHDYFTSALPYLQKGTAIALAADVVGDPAGTASLGLPAFWAADSTPATEGYLYANAGGTDTNVNVKGAFSINDKLHWRDPELVANVDINALRQSVAIQRLLERDARGGTRYVELIKTHFGVTSPDFRLQRPEYLGGGKAYINVSPVANASGVDSTVSVSGADEPQGELRGIGTGVISGHSWAKSFTEHGYIMGLIRARADLTYFQGIDRMWRRSTRYDFYIPALANLGEQSILNSEIFASNSAGTDNLVFGYQERWAEYRMKHSRLVGHFNPDISGSLSHWHLAEDFSSLPSLNAAFIYDTCPMSRITTVDSEPDFLLDLWFDYKCARPMPVYSIPSLSGGRF